MKIAGAIFDLDGTLLDSMPIWESLGETYLKDKGIEPKEGLREVLRPMSLVQSAEYFRSNYGVRESVEEICGDINHLIQDYYFDTVKPKPGVMDFLEHLKMKQIKMCVATATDRFLVDAALKRNKMDSYFDRIFTCSEAGYGKDRPDIYLQALDFLGTMKEKTMIFEDALYAARTAKDAGFPVGAVYDSSAASQQAEIKRLADIYIRSFEETGELL